ncbi:protein trichome birefringence-like 3 isoform X1 [Nicotiana tomentosiformis]|uniref:protein trichome birefringence-like 3 isoform X1 n=1 Tax=Nicotiana tomentosiformis TaxID=4098 RepID=UPI00051B8128|nr:protein trichome birefringence-like 3 isoform X1 [Nicotiana tomentosiformis]
MFHHSVALTFIPPITLPCFILQLSFSLLLHCELVHIHPFNMGWTKSAKRKLSFPIITAIICTLTFIFLLYTERISTISYGSILRFKPCPKRNSADDRELQSDQLDNPTDESLDFDPDECSVTHGKWVFNTSIKPLYSDMTCPFIDKQYSCIKNGRNDSDYRYWEWQPDDCMLPSFVKLSIFRFDPEIALRKLRGKRLMFVGDSLQRNQWESFVCLIESVIPKGKKSMKRGHVHSVFKAKEYDATIEFYWAPFLVESNTDIPIKSDPKQRIIKVDSIAQRAKHWLGADILVFNTYVWWMSGLKTKALWGEFENGEEGYEELDTTVSYRVALRTWANWIDSTVDPKKTRVFFTTMSPSHQKNKEWGNINGIRCYNETRPVMKKGHWGTGSNKEMMNVVANVMGRMKVPVTVLNITQLSEYRIDAHTSIYGELRGKLLTAEQRANPLHFADCIHWCLPGVPDTWNQLLFAYL